MNWLIARAYVTTQLDAPKLSRLHDLENRDGAPWTPWAIASAFQIEPVGPIPEDMSLRVEARLMAKYERSRAQYRARHTGCCFRDADGGYTRSDKACPPANGPGNADLILVHQLDQALYDESFEMPRPQSGGSKIRAAMERRAG